MKNVKSENARIFPLEFKVKPMPMRMKVQKVFVVTDVIMNI